MLSFLLPGIFPLYGREGKAASDFSALQGWVDTKNARNQF
jgi:hypothetical protein